MCAYTVSAPDWLWTCTEPHPHLISLPCPVSGRYWGSSHAEQTPPVSPSRSSGGQGLVSHTCSSSVSFSPAPFIREERGTLGNTDLSFLHLERLCFVMGSDSKPLHQLDKAFMSFILERVKGSGGCRGKRKDEAMGGSGFHHSCSPQQPGSFLTALIIKRSLCCLRAFDCAVSSSQKCWLSLLLDFSILRIKQPFSLSWTLHRLWCVWVLGIHSCL